MRHPTMLSLKHFAHQHDDLPAFHAAFLVLTFLMAAMFNLGVFALVIIAHMALDSVKYREVHGLKGRAVWEGMIRESLVDITLFVIGLAFSVYLHHSLPVIGGLSGLARSEATMIRALTQLVPKMKILHHMLCFLSNIHGYLAHIHPRLGKEWSTIDKLCILSCMIALALVAAAPVLIPIDLVHLIEILEHELIPGIS